MAGRLDRASSSEVAPPTAVMIGGLPVRRRHCLRVHLLVRCQMPSFPRVTRREPTPSAMVMTPAIWKMPPVHLRIGSHSIEV